MEFNIAPMRDFLWESYGIYTTTEFLKSVQDCSEQEKNERFIDHALDNMFLFRVKRDPGFKLFIRDKVDANPVLQERIRHIVMYLFGKTSGLDYIDEDAPGPKGEMEILIQAINAGKNPFEEVIRHSKNPSLMHQYNEDRLERERVSKTKYLEACLDEAAGHMDNELEMIAIRQQMLEYGTGKYHGHVLAADDPLFPFAGFTADTQRLASNYIFKNIKYRERFYGYSNQMVEDPSLHECTIWQIPYEIILQEAIFGKSVREFVDNIECIQNCQDLAKFELDLATIAYQEWFLTLSRKDKISVLNDDYPFEIRDDLLEEIIGFVNNSLDILQFRMEQLYNAKYYEHAAKIGEFVFNRLEDGKEKYFTASNIATYYREFEDYQNALKWYQNAKKLTKHLTKNPTDPNNGEYKEFIEWKNCAEMEFYIHGSDHFRNEIDKIQQNAQNLPDYARNSIELNLAEACRRTGHHDLEYEHLTEAITINELEDKYFIHISGRLDYFNRTLYDSNFETIRESERLMKTEVYERRYTSATQSYQYIDARRWIDRLIRLKPKPYLYQEKAALCRHAGKDDEAIDMLRKATEATDNPREKASCLISTALIKCQKTGSIDAEIEDLVSSSLLSLGKESENTVQLILSKIVNPIVFDVVTWSDDDLRNQFLETLATEYEKCGFSGNPDLIIGAGFHSFHFCQEARERYERALPNADSAPERVHIMSQIGSTLFLEGNYRSAGKWCKKAMQEDPDNDDIILGMTQCHIALMEYDLAAKTIQKARTINPDNITYKQVQKGINSLASHVISLQRIESEEIRQTFRTGDWLLFSVFNAQERDEYDIGPVVIEYGKGVEKLLYESLLKPIRQTIHSDTTYFSSKFGIKKTFWEGSSNKHAPLPRTIKTVLGKEEKSLSLGQWAHLVNDLKDADTNPLVQEFRNLLRKRGCNTKRLRQIGNLCGRLSNERNGAAHISFYSRDEVQKKWGEMVTIINDIIARVPSSGPDSLSK
ncbi:tetratricopeptide repeat protein [Methanogenium organophilum]|uniref:Tetratricopeptide repeat protein n=1 Tax=Methanogenium organophilum TaxID=2199 RepID=A0A9X9S3N3_METOG|nr:tetratricopeptide repeat protein [Methanogenium organophilum]WAI00951.1 tetratricopeptide repeat protein [Methanogenium organophilum]